LFGGIATALPVAAASLFPEFWLQLLYGAEYAGYGSLLRWYGIIYLIVFLATPLSAALRALEYTRPIFLSGLAAAVISGGAIYPLITTFGLNGVIMGILLVTIIRQIILAHAVALAFGQHRSPLATVNHDVDRKVRP
jgi:O-antigen/teichoic acid export membrane protein